MQLVHPQHGPTLICLKSVHIRIVGPLQCLFWDFGRACKKRSQDTRLQGENWEMKPGRTTTYSSLAIFMTNTLQVTMLQHVPLCLNKKGPQKIRWKCFNWGRNCKLSPSLKLIRPRHHEKKRLGSTVRPVGAEAFKRGAWVEGNWYCQV